MPHCQCLVRTLAESGAQTIKKNVHFIILSQPTPKCLGRAKDGSSSHTAPANRGPNRRSLVRCGVIAHDGGGGGMDAHARENSCAISSPSVIICDGDGGNLDMGNALSVLRAPMGVGQKNTQLSD